jgi:hypothetical protein
MLRLARNYGSVLPINPCIGSYRLRIEIAFSDKVIVKRPSKPLI